VERIDTSLPDVWILKPRVFADNRGFFMESYNRRDLASIGIDEDFVQDNHSQSRRGVLRGLHYQLGVPQAKLVRVTRGSVFDVAVDIRRGSPSFGRWMGADLTEDNNLMMFIPRGFAHGFLVLSETAEFQYKCSDYYSPEEERGIAWNDPRIGIEWPFGDVEPILSGRDGDWANLNQLDERQLPVYEP
jgi:dTDP-4-dehydrorhamnose 3,5-epimerase